MTAKSLIFGLGILFISFSACKKEVVVPVMPMQNIAPCQLTTKSYHLDSVYYSNSSRFPNAAFRVKFIDTGTVQESKSLEFAFNKIPVTGMYFLVHAPDLGNPLYDNQVAFEGLENGFAYLSEGTDFDSARVHIEYNENELIISFCEIPGGLFYYESSLNAYVGNGPDFLKYRKAF